MILGASGSGKSTSLRNFKADEIGIFNVASKPLPFRGDLKKVDKAGYTLITKVLKDNKLRCYAIDDSQFLMVFDEFNRAKEIGYQKFTDFALNFYNLVQTVINDTSPDTVVYFLHHTEIDDFGHIKAKTVGKMIDNKQDWALVFNLTGINSYTVALIPFVVFSLTGVITKYDLEEINWSVLWMVAGGFALGYGLNASGLAENAVKSIPFGSFSPLLILVLSGVICYMLSNFISNSATAALLMPILAVVCTAMGDKLGAIGGTPTILIGIAVAVSSAMLLPVSTPPNALAFSTNLVKQSDMVKVGLIVGIISMILGYALLYGMGVAHVL